MDFVANFFTLPFLTGELLPPRPFDKNDLGTDEVAVSKHEIIETMKTKVAANFITIDIFIILYSILNGFHINLITGSMDFFYLEALNQS